MSDPTPNTDQQELINGTEGIYLVDAGAGTGKTFAITRRYTRILEQPDIQPEDILLVTFTRSAAGEMRDRIVQRSEYEMKELQDAPINTFHAYCYRLLRRYGHSVPHHLGIDEYLSRSLDLLEDGVREAELFRTFASQFEDAHPEYEEMFATIGSVTELRSLIGQLAAKGVIPKEDGWYRGSADLLLGSREEFLETFREANQPGEGSRGATQSDALSRIKDAVDSDMNPYPPNAPSYESVSDGKQANEDLIMEAFDEDRDALIDFLHDLYFDYLSFALSRNYLTQGLMLAMAFVMLCEDDYARQQARHQYVMVDEFQDTNELQFKIALLLAEEANLCVVGDWKQSIYGFQYTSVENIRNFDSRLARYHADLNADRRRLPYDIGDINEIRLKKNYRSTQDILTFAEESLTIPASSREDIDEAAIRAEVKSLESVQYVENSSIASYTHENELELVLDRVQHIVGNPDFAIERHDNPTVDEDASEEKKRAAEESRLAPPQYEDIAVFTRKRAFARDLIEAAESYDVPLAYEGGIELYDTDQAKLLLAWLRIVETDARRGWAVVLEEAGYTLPQAKVVLDDAAYPEEMVAFRDRLREMETLGGLAREVFDAYGFDGAYASALLEEVTGLYEATVYTRGEAIELIEENLENGTTPNVDTNPGQNSATLQTIHSAKGLEYPIVILANLNYRAFPHFGVSSSAAIRYDDTLGIRQTEMLDTSTGRPHVFDRWQYDLLSNAYPPTYDEERRLLYVAMTRAKRHLLFTAGENPSQFFEGLSLDAVEHVPSVTSDLMEPESEPALDVSIPSPDGPIRAGVHDIMDETVYEAVTEGRGAEFGAELHDFAEAYAKGEAVTADDDEHAGIVTLIDSLAGTLLPEQTVLFPVDGDPRIVLTGIIDLLHIDTDRVDIIDYKTDLQRHAHEEYCKQLSVYYHVLEAVYPEREIVASVYYTADAELVEIDPWEVSAIRDAAEEFLTEQE